MKISAEAAITEIFRQLKGQAPLAIEPLKGGVVNAVYAVSLPDTDFVIRMRPDCLDVYIKEAWAMAQAARVGVSVPAVHQVGDHEGTAYMIMDRIDGDTLSDLPGNKLPQVRELGRLSRLINSVSVQGFGFHLDMLPAPHFRESWQETMQWEKEFIFGNDALIQMGAMDRHHFNRAQEFLEPMMNWQSEPHLTHSDISLANAMQGKDGAVYILDWTMTKGSPVPVFEIANFATSAQLDQIEAFVEGYGLTPAEYKALKPDADRITLSSVLRAAVWAAGEKHPQMSKFIQDVKRVSQTIFP